MVNSTNTAITARSGTLPVFGTPFMIALMEKATCNAVFSFLEEDETTVGTKINVSHTKASGIGTMVSAKAVITECCERKITFEVTATDNEGDIIGKGTIERFVVNENKFMKRVGTNEI
ncbi:MAG: thioesterase [Eubacterium sp.]|nr:thioesterase [Eubacterium sp.]